MQLDPEALLLVWSRGGASACALVRQLCYHHCVQGELGGLPYVVSFCSVCNGGVGFNPTLEGQVHHFSCGGLNRGQSLLIDDETHSYWEPLTGECVHGRLAGKRVEVFSVDLCTVSEALKRDPDLSCMVADRGLAQVVFGRFGMFRMRGKGFLPPGFKGTMGGEDTRRPRMEQGLGVVVLKEARFYPESVIAGSGDAFEDAWGRRRLRVRLREDGFPHASWDDGSAPLQFQVRWYAFAFSYPDCRVVTSPAD